MNDAIMSGPFDAGKSKDKPTSERNNLLIFHSALNFKTKKCDKDKISESKLTFWQTISIICSIHG